METLNIIVQTKYNETIFKVIRFNDGELKVMTSFPHILSGCISLGGSNVSLPLNSL